MLYSDINDTLNIARCSRYISKKILGCMKKGLSAKKKRKARYNYIGLG